MIKYECKNCGHDCHCSYTCDANPYDGGCSCEKCDHRKQTSLWGRFVDWLFDWS